VSTLLTPTAAAMQWPEVEAGFWVANADGNFGGTVERAGRRFVARDALGGELGRFADAASAKRAVEERFRAVLGAVTR
jgi:hypothetical protein